jgi:hypothetical protein
MKMIVAIKPACRRPRSLIRHCLLPKGRKAREVEGVREDDHRVIGLINGMTAGSVGSPAVTARNLCGDVPAGRAPLRPIVISAEDTEAMPDRLDAFAALTDVAQQWLAAYAPHSPFLAITHDDTRHPHVHLLVANTVADEEETRLAWSPSVVSEMQSLAWVSDSTKQEFAIESGRHRGATRRESRGMPYPNAQLDALKLAKLENEQIYERIKSGDITVARRNKAGEITSIIYEGRRIRLSTIRHMAAHQGCDVPSGGGTDRSHQRAKRQRRTPRGHRGHTRHRSGPAIDVG